MRRLLLAQQAAYLVAGALGSGGVRLLWDAFREFHNSASLLENQCFFERVLMYGF